MCRDALARPCVPVPLQRMSVDRESFRDALSHWASGVTIVALREEHRIVAVTVSSFLSLSLDPPLVMIALGPNASVRPYVSAGKAVGISMLSGAQRRLASVYADAYPVGEDPFGPEDPPLLRELLTGIRGHVTETRTAGDHMLAVVNVDRLIPGTGTPLIRYRRRYHELSE
jgi:flavin reductase (NADH)